MTTFKEAFAAKSPLRDNSFPFRFAEPERA